MPRSRRDKKRAGKAKNFKMKQGHKAFFVFDRVGREIRHGKIKADIEASQEVFNKSVDKAIKDNDSRSFVSKVLSPFRPKDK